jgi:hypothetical protein
MRTEFWWESLLENTYFDDREGDGRITLLVDCSGI